MVEAKESVSLGLLSAVILGTLILGRDPVKAPWELADLFTYHYKNYKPDYYFPKDVPWGEWIQIALFAILGCLVLGVTLDRYLNWRESGSKFLGRLQSKNGATVAGWVLAGLIFGVFGAQIYFNRLAQHWGHKYLLETYYEQRQPGESLIAYQMNWRGETFYGANQDDQTKKNAPVQKIDKETRT